MWLSACHLGDRRELCVAKQLAPFYHSTSRNLFVLSVIAGANETFGLVRGCVRPSGVCFGMDYVAFAVYMSPPPLLLRGFRVEACFASVLSPVTLPVVALRESDSCFFFASVCTT